MREVLRPVLASAEVHHVGDVVAAVVAETRYQALDALEAIDVEYEPLPATVKTGGALDSDAAIVHEQFGTNQINEVIRGGKTATAAAFAKAAHTVGMTLTSNRVAGSPLEPRSYVGITRRRPINVHCGRRRRCRICCGGGSANTRCSSPSTSCALSLRMWAVDLVKRSIFASRFRHRVDGARVETPG